MIFKKYRLPIVSVSLVLTLMPLAAWGADLNGFALTTGELLNPDKWFQILKQNITIPISGNTTIEVPTPENALKESSPQLQKVNTDVREQTGIDFAKFIGWFAGILKVFFQIIVDLLQSVSSSLKS